MTDQVNPFEQLLNTQGVTPDQGAKSDMSNLLTMITNEKGEPKYKSVEDAIVALKNSQEHISTLETENKTLREWTQKAQSMEQILAQLDSTKNNLDDNQNSFRMEDVESLVLKTLEKTEAQRKANANLSKVKETLMSSFGEKFTTEYENKAKELGLSVQVLDQLATVSPQAVLEYFGKSSVKAPAKQVQGSVNTELFQNHNVRPQPPKSIMYGASTNDMVAAWKAVSENLNQ